MVTSTYNKFNTAVEYFANGMLRCSSVGDVFSFLLTNTVPTSTWQTSTNNTAISTGNGYSSVGTVVSITSSTLGSTNTVPTPVIVLGSTVVFTASSANSTAGIGPFRYVIFCSNSTTGIIGTTGTTEYWPSALQVAAAAPAGYPLISWYDYGSAITLTPGETFTISPDGSSGIFQIA